MCHPPSCSTEDTTAPYSPTVTALRRAVLVLTVSVTVTVVVELIVAVKLDEVARIYDGIIGVKAVVVEDSIEAASQQKAKPHASSRAPVFSVWRA